MKEVDLSPLLEAFFKNMSYVVKSEVMHMDMMCCKEDQCFGVELKLDLSLKVINQALDRLKMIDTVYIATLKPKKESETFKEKKRIIKALGIGLIYVDVSLESVHIEFDPTKPIQVRKKEAIKLKKEFDQRRLSKNEAGMHQKKVMTVYKEQLLVLLGALYHHSGKFSEIKKMYNINNIQGKLYKNYYGWFKHIYHGVYQVSDKGLKAYALYEKDIKHLLEHYKKTDTI
jgi:hypothetical protein